MAHKKILFALVKDDENYPAIDIEGVWAQEQADGSYKIDNIPFFTRQATFGDIVEAKPVGMELFYESTIKRSGNSLLRVVFFDGHDPSWVRSKLDMLGCSSEQSHLSSLISVNVPATVDFDEIRTFLDEGCNEGFWDYEESIIRH